MLRRHLGGKPCIREMRRYRAYRRYEEILFRVGDNVGDNNIITGS